jgi:hypothetical protein
MAAGRSSLKGASFLALFLAMSGIILVTQLRAQGVFRSSAFVTATLATPNGPVDVFPQIFISNGNLDEARSFDLGFGNSAAYRAKVSTSACQPPTLGISSEARNAPQYNAAASSSVTWFDTLFITSEGPIPSSGIAELTYEIDGSLDVSIGAGGQAFASANVSMLVFPSTNSSGGAPFQRGIFNTQTSRSQAIKESFTFQVPWTYGSNQIGVSITTGSVCSPGGSCRAKTDFLSKETRLVAFKLLDSAGTPVPNAVVTSSSGTDYVRPGTGCQLPDLTISSLQPAQVVFGKGTDDKANGDLVVGKPAVVRVKVHYDRIVPGVFDDTTSFVTRLTIPGIGTQTQTHRLSELPTNDFPVDFYFTPQQAGTLSFTAEVNPPDGTGQRPINESDPSNNIWPAQAGSASTAVRNTAALSVGFIRVDCDPNDPLDHDSVQSTAVKAFDFATSVFPVNPSSSVLGIDLEDHPSLCRPAPARLGGETDAAYEARLTKFQAELVWQVWMEGRFAGFGTKRTIAVVSDDWMAQIYPSDPAGFTFCGYPSAIVSVHTWEAVAHELGHTYGLNDQGEHDTCNKQPGSLSTAGFWVSRKQAQDVARSLMGTDPDGSYPENHTWPTRDDYERLLDTFAQNPADPELLLVSGAISRDGGVSMNPLYRVASGFPDTAIPGEYAVRLLDSAGRELFALPFDVAFVTLHPTRPTDQAPFAFAIPYVAGAATLEISQNGIRLERFGIASRLLSDAVRSIPEPGFVKRNQKNTLLNKVLAVENQIASGNDFGARQKLEHDVRVHVDAWLLDRYAVTSRLAYTKQQLLELVDSLIAQLPR